MNHQNNESKVHILLSPFQIGKLKSRQTLPTVLLNVGNACDSNLFPSTDLCSEMALSCMNLRSAFPPENPIICNKPSHYCCDTDLCNTNEISRQKLYRVEQSPAAGKHPALLWLCDLYNDNADF